jgi:hypothetical protein
MKYDETELLVAAERLSKNLLAAHKEFEKELANYTINCNEEEIAKAKLKLEDLIEAWKVKDDFF